MSHILSLDHLSASHSGKEIIHDFSGSIQPGELVGLVGENGAGKTTLALALLGHPDYSVTGKITFAGTDLTPLDMFARARLGLFLAWQNPVALSGVTPFQLCKAAYRAHGRVIANIFDFKHELVALAEKVGLDPKILTRPLSEGVSGGEAKRLEFLQLLLLRPKLAILDELDSGLDVQGRAVLASLVTALAQSGTAFLVISHYPTWLSDLGVSRYWKLPA